MTLTLNLTQTPAGLLELLPEALLVGEDGEEVDDGEPPGEDDEGLDDGDHGRGQLVLGREVGHAEQDAEQEEDLAEIIGYGIDRCVL